MYKVLGLLQFNNTIVGVRIKDLQPHYVETSGVTDVFDMDLDNANRYNVDTTGAKIIPLKTVKAVGVNGKKVTLLISEEEISKKIMVKDLFDPIQVSIKVRDEILTNQVKESIKQVKPTKKPKESVYAILESIRETADEYNSNTNYRFTLVFNTVTAFKKVQKELGAMLIPNSIQSSIESRGTAKCSVLLDDLSSYILDTLKVPKYMSHTVHYSYNNTYERGYSHETNLQGPDFNCSKDLCIGSVADLSLLNDFIKNLKDSYPCR